MKNEINSVPGAVSGGNPAAKTLKVVLEKAAADSADFGNVDSFDNQSKVSQM